MWLSGCFFALNKTVVTVIVVSPRALRAFQYTNLSSIVVDGEGWALVFGGRVSIAVLGGERETVARAGLQLG